MSFSLNRRLSVGLCVTLLALGCSGAGDRVTTGSLYEEMIDMAGLAEFPVPTRLCSSPLMTGAAICRVAPSGSPIRTGLAENRYRDSRRCFRNPERIASECI